jgi:dihydropteroate synthase
MNPAAIRRPLLMGILNVTPDSFSDGGEHYSTDTAVARALEMVDEGADIIDIGGESTRPGAERIPVDGQLRRVLPVIERLRPRLPSEIGISIDTTLSGVAEAAIAGGATLINDVSAGREDGAMFGLAARLNVPIVLMHMKGTPATMQVDPQYGDAVAEILDFLLQRAAAAQEAGIARDAIVVDPGIGFGKTREHNLELIAALSRFVESGYPVLLGTSRKRFMGAICKVDRYSELVGATCATTALGVMAGAKIFRVHDVRENRQALDVAWAIRERKPL